MKVSRTTQSAAPEAGSMPNRNLYHDKRAQWAFYLAFFGILALIMSTVDNAFLLNQLAVFGVYGLLAMSISLCWGIGGILNLGQGISFGLAAYCTAMTMQMQSQDPEMNPVPPFMLNNGLEQLPWFWELFWSTGGGLFLALAVPTAFCLLFGSLLFQARVSGPFFAIISLAMLSAIYTLVIDIQPYTNGVNGISPPMPLEVFGTMLDPYSPAAFWLVFILLAVLTLLAKLLTQSKFGQVVKALKDDPERVRFLGYSVALYETLIYSISGFIAEFHAAACGFQPSADEIHQGGLARAIRADQTGQGAFDHVQAETPYHVVGVELLLQVTNFENSRHISLLPLATAT
jgi:urea transport system permease protein